MKGTSKQWWVQRILETSVDEIMNVGRQIVEDERTFRILGEILKFGIVTVSAIGYILGISSMGVALAVHQYYTGFDVRLLATTIPTFTALTLLLTFTHWTATGFAHGQLEKIWPSMSLESAEREEEKTKAYRLKVVEDDRANEGHKEPLYMSANKKDAIRETGPLGLFVKDDGFAIAASPLDETNPEAYLFQREKFMDGVFIRSLETNSLLTLLKKDNTFLITKILAMIGCVRRRPPIGMLSVLNPHTWSGNGDVKATERERFEFKASHEGEGQVLYNPYYNVFIQIKRTGNDVQYVGVTKSAAATRFVLEMVRKNDREGREVKEVKEE